MSNFSTCSCTPSIPANPRPPTGMALPNVRHHAHTICMSPAHSNNMTLLGMQVHPAALTGVIRPGCVMLGLNVACPTPESTQQAWSAMLSHDAWDDAFVDQRSNVDFTMSCDGATYAVSEWQLALSDASPSPLCAALLGLDSV